MNLSKWKTIIPMVAVASLAGLAVAAAPTQAAAASPVGDTHVSGVDLSKLPLTNRHLNRHEIANLETVLGAYHDAEGNSLDPDAFVNSFTKDGVFTSVVTNQSYRGAALRNVVISTAALFPDVHRDLRSVTVSGDTVSIQLHIQGTFEGPLQTPAGTLKPTGAKVDYPTDDFFFLQNGKIKEFDCLIGLSAELNQLGVNFDWASAVAAG
ncbi:MAG TPA: nuclear transport factor 2 family protein [Pseudonocardiaceae bacterium]|jgi:predicted ester cyclase